MKKITTLLVAFLISSLLFAQGSGKMLDFNGSSSYVDCGTLNISGSALTLQTWVKVDAFKTVSPFISTVMGTETPGVSHAQVRMGDGGLAANKVQFILLIGGTNHKLNGVQGLNTNTWYHIAASIRWKNGRSICIYKRTVSNYYSRLDVQKNKRFASQLFYIDSKLFNERRRWFYSS